MKGSIQARLLVVTALVLVISLGAAGLVLERAFRTSVLAGAEEQLRLVVYGIMGGVVSADSRLSLPGPPPEPRLGELGGSGLYAWITDAKNIVQWRSTSSHSLPPTAFSKRNGGLVETVNAAQTPSALAPGGFDFHTDSAGPMVLLHLRYAVIWEAEPDRVLTFHVAGDDAPFAALIDGFRRRLLLGLGGVGLLLALAQYLAVRWGLRPLRAMTVAVRELEDGHRQRLGTDYPGELVGLAENLDRFVVHEDGRRRRYRRAMDDLAHSLKTPLAVVRNALDGISEDRGALLREQLERMERTVDHQLSRAAVTGPVVGGSGRPLAVLLRRLVNALQVAYRDREIDFHLEVPEDLQVRGDERDLMELYGNVLDNAFKYTRTHVRVSAGQGPRTWVLVEDDGRGIAPELHADVLGRGTRADEIESGQGIGLAVVAELVESYGGRLSLDASPLGGLAVRIELP